MTYLEENVFYWINGLGGRQPFVDAIVLIFASDYLLPVIFAASIFALWFSGKNRRVRFRIQWWVLVGASSMGLSSLTVLIITFIWPRPRPFIALPDTNLLFYPSTDPSFPANPVAVGIAAASAAWMVNRRLGALLFILALLLGFCRVYAGVFYPTDVLGSVALGILVTIAAAYFHRLLHPGTIIFIRYVRGLALG